MDSSSAVFLPPHPLMAGNPKPAERGLGEQALGHHAIAAGFQGQRQWTDHFPNGDFLEAVLDSSFDHCVLTAGHVGHLYITLASLLRIPVYMHNIPEERIFRPAAWRLFGTAGAEGADFRACANFGPLYG